MCLRSFRVFGWGPSWRATEGEAQRGSVTVSLAGEVCAEWPGGSQTWE